MADVAQDITKHSMHTLVFRSLKRSHDMFISDQAAPVPNNDAASKLSRSVKTVSEYGPVLHMAKDKKKTAKITSATNGTQGDSSMLAIMDSNQKDISNGTAKAKSSANVTVNPDDIQRLHETNKALLAVNSRPIAPRKAQIMPKPRWHAPWKLYRVISGHLGWVRSVAFEPGNEWFVTGSNDRTIKIWDLASGKLKLSLTGHISSVRGLAVSARNPYLFSCGEDKMVKCWDLEQNKVIRHYHGHLSACYALDLHPTIDVLVTCGRDSSARVWDMRTKANIMTLSGHTNTVADVKCQAALPEVITASHDCTVRLWDLAAGKTRSCLTNHKKSIRSIAMHPTQYTFASGAPDNIKQWKFPDGDFIQNMSGHNAIVNCLALSSDGVLVSGADNGTVHLWDWRTGYNFQRTKAPVQPGSLDSESGVFAMAFDKSESRLVTCEADKTIKIYKEDDEASEESHPINWKPEIVRKKRF
uniref:pleiotropic regulator 1 n=1 Tax=Ciona intestinalis TaxID=7719 RepID=UPI000224B5BB|nr:pleiotropic regulator 1 [Ciona intestinalis]|eukprot:XP_004226862.1 pleiotropic regulator 1 [Ciona intestinalis]